MQTIMGSDLLDTTTHKVTISTEFIAKVAHNVNRAYCQAINDDSQPTWETAPEWQKRSAINGVNAHRTNPAMTAEMSHESWLQEKLADGWKYGAVKNPDTKEHPCCVDYAQLPEGQKIKDYLFKAVVESFSTFG
jgi:hypothetical protein